jgi:hypothetical protein
MIKITPKGHQLLLEYTSDTYYSNGAGWIDDELKNGSVTLKRNFTFTQPDLIPTVAKNVDEDEVRVFILGITDGDYYKINATVLGLKHDLRLWKGMRLSNQTFVAHRDISIFRRIDSLTTEAIVIGGSEVNSIPLQDFGKSFKKFSNIDRVNALRKR